MKTKISHLLALLTIAVAAVLIEDAFLQSITVNNQAYDLIARTAVNEISPQNLSLLKAADKVSLADAVVPLFPGAKKLTFGDVDSVRYRVDASAGKVAGFYSQIMSSLGWQKINGSSQAAAAGEKLNRVIIALAENPITKKTEVIFSAKPLSRSGIFSAQAALAEETVTESAPQAPAETPLSPQPPVEPQPLMPSDNNQIQPPQPQPAPSGPGQFTDSTNAPQPTCRVNGVEMPGDCSQYNNGSNMQGLEFGRPEGQPGGQSGPSEEDMKKMDERRLKDMKRGLSQFTRSAKSMKKNVDRMKTTLSKCGVGIPEELTNALASVGSLAEKINNAQSADELDEAVGDIEDVGAVMQDWGPRLGELNRLCQMLRQADRDFKQVERSLKRYQAKNTAKTDISEILAEYQANVETMRQALNQAKELSKTDPEEALTKIEDDFYGNMDNVRNSEQAVDMILNIGRGISQANSEIRRIDQNIKALKRKKVATADLEALAAEYKEKLAGIKRMIKEKVGAEELINEVEAVFDVREKIYDALQEYGIGSMEPQIKENKSFNMQVNLPDAFKRQGGNEEGDNQGQGDSQNGPGMNSLQPQSPMPRF